jgi:2,4-dienoyl-CoA reductase-like NADH-dependent reductase (Old Yellow Enzyme family)
LELVQVLTSLSLQSLQVGSLKLRNRIVFAATVNNLGLNLEITDEQIAFYTERAIGGVGAIVTEGLSVHASSIPNPTVPLAYDERLIPGFARLAESVHLAGAAIFGQLWHVGRQALWNPSLAPWGVSGQRDPYSGSTPHVMTECEIFQVIDGFVTAAKNLFQAGFDGVELHGAHGFLITQFFSPLSNLRTDQWGGSLENRCRFAVEITRRIREATGDSFVVGIKLPVHEYTDGGLDLEGSQAITDHLVRNARPDYFATGQGNFSPSLEKHVPDLHFQDLAFEHLHKGIRSVSDGVPVMAVTKVPDVAAADGLIERGSADFVGFSRALIADAHMVRKTIEGLLPRPCIYCNVCWDFIHTGRAIACTYAPETGREAELSQLKKGGRSGLKVHVIGGGPAGLEFARVMLQEGNTVHVHEATGALGGRLHREALVPGRENYQKAVEWYRQEIRRLGGQMSLNDEVQLEHVGWLDGDVTVVAIGAVPIVDGLVGVDKVFALEEVISSSAEVSGPLVIVDEIEGEPVYGVAEALAARGLEVSIVTRQPSIGRRVPYVNLIGVFRRLDEANVKLHTSSIPIRAVDGELIVAHALSGRERSLGHVATIVRAGPYQTSIQDHSLFDLVVGDASAPRELLAVVREANIQARTLLSQSGDIGA